VLGVGYFVGIVRKLYPRRYKYSSQLNLMSSRFVCNFIMRLKDYSAMNRLPGELLPDFFTTWTELFSLELRNNFIYRQIPPEIASLTKLKYLSILNNSLSGIIHPEVRNLTSLTYLDLTMN